MLLIRDTNGLTQEDRAVIWKIMMYSEMAFPDCMAERTTFSSVHAKKEEQFSRF